MKIHVGLKENVRVVGRRSVEATAKFDTGANRSCIDMSLAAKAQVGPIVGSARVFSGTNRRGVRRPIVMATIRVRGKKIELPVSVGDRSHSSAKVLIGRDIIKGKFIIDVER